MKISDVSIARPVFTTMVISALVVFGVLLYTRLSVDLYPEVDFPIVTVTTVYPGASPETMEEQVTDPIEEAVNSLSGIRSLRSASVEGVSQVFVEFELGVPLDVAAQDVRDRVASVARDLPDAAEDSTVEKLDLGAAPILQLSVSGEDARALSDYVENQLKPELERVQGVGQVQLIGLRPREIEVLVDLQALQGYRLTVQDLVSALGRQNIEVPAGNSGRGRQDLVLRTDARFADVHELGATTIATVNGIPVSLAQVARVVDGFEEQASVTRLDGRTAVAVALIKQSDANTVAVAEGVHAQLAALRASAPAGIAIELVQDNSTIIVSSIETVQLDLVLGAALAILIIFIFLRDWRATLISAMALPTSVVGTFAFVQIMGFTLNMMTTMALSLSIGILIDDAIVVIENIVRRRTELKESAMDAAQRGTAEIGLAVFATTMSIVAVFVPVAFMDGMIGQFFYEFGMTVAVAVLISLFVSFTLTPMLSARFLSAHHGHGKGLSALIEKALNGLDSLYRKVIRLALRQRFLTFATAVVVLFASFGAAGILGFEFMPIEDKSQFNVLLELPPGSNLDATDEAAQQIANALAELPGVTSTFTTVGGGAQEQKNVATVLVLLVPPEQRGYHQTEIMAFARERFAGVTEYTVAVEQAGDNPGGSGRNAAIQLNLRGGDLSALQAAGNRIAARLREIPGYVDVDTSFREGKPELRVDVRRAVIDDLGISADTVAATARTLFAGTVATQLADGDERIDVRVRLPEENRNIYDAARANVISSQGRPVPLGIIADVTLSSGPSRVDREARQRQVTIYANLNGKVLGDAMPEVQAIANEEIGADIQAAFGGEAQMMEESMASMLLSIFLAVICVYMILAAQFESFLHPLTIMSSLPFSLIGAFGGLLVTGNTMTIFAMIGLIMLFGLVTKNAILLIDFAIQLRATGQSIPEALENAGATRLRPILMTTAAMTFGMLPVAIGHGDGGEVRAPMGIVIIGGLITSTILTLVVVPVLYSLLEGMRMRVARLFTRTPHETAEVTP
ncbi:MAG: efflux RND transporter permease subunit [Sandaracinaceae bacterium]|nr:efflux RND transporter permease subunit [Sandaracinaceae bacterium]